MTHGSLFTGIGGIDLGFEWAGIETKWQVEIDNYCQELLSVRFPHTEKFTDIHKVGSHNLEKVDIISGGFPCQDISVAGKGAGIEGERSGLWTELHRVISELRPRFAFIENVPMLTIRGGTRVIADLAEIGYDAEWQIIGADEVGAWHKRKRIWIVAYPDANMERGKRSYKNMKSRIERKMPLNLNDQLNAIEKGLLPEPKNFPTPTAQDSKNDGGPSQYRRKSLPLNAIVKNFPTPTAPGKHQVGTIGEWGGSGNPLRTPENTRVKTGSLNPTWVEWLMGFPIGWTDLEDSETQ